MSLRKKDLAQKAINKANKGLVMDGNNVRNAPVDQRFKRKNPRFDRLLVVVVLVLCFVSLPSFSTDAASQVNLRSANTWLKPTLTPSAALNANASLEKPLESDIIPTPDTYYTSYTYHSWDIPDEITGTSTLWIEIDLTNQMLYAYRGNQLISGFLVSTGTSSYKTVTGTFKIYSKYPAYTMIGPGYHLEDVPFSMFFYKGYSIHGTYWHSNFGTPMSHGCVNMATDEAAWVYDNAPVGTYVFVHY